MSVIIIIDPPKAKAAIDILQAACARGEIGYDEAQEINEHLRALIEKAKHHGHCD